MAQKTNTYRKLPGKRLNWFGSRSLWQGSDHLLWVEGSIMHERYKRFYYKDIQAVIMARSSRRTVFAVLWGVLALLFGIVTLVLTGPSNPAYVSMTFTIGFTLLFAINFMLGDTCEVFIQTAIQLERISCLARVPKSQQTLDRIKVRVERSQGMFQAQTLSHSDGTFTNGASGMYTKADAKEPSSDFNPIVHRVLFGLLTGMGIVRGVQIWLKSILLAGMDMFAMALSLVLVIVVLVRWHAHIKGTMVSVVSWFTAVFIVIHCIAAYGFFLAVNFLNPQAMYNYWVTFKALFEMQTGDHMTIMVYSISVAALSLVSGLWGLAAIFTTYRQPIAQISVRNERPDNNEITSR